MKKYFKFLILVVVLIVLCTSVSANIERLFGKYTTHSCGFSSGGFAQLNDTNLGGSPALSNVCSNSGRWEVEFNASYLIKNVTLHSLYDGAGPFQPFNVTVAIDGVNRTIFRNDGDDEPAPDGDIYNADYTGLGYAGTNVSLIFSEISTSVGMYEWEVYLSPKQWQNITLSNFTVVGAFKNATAWNTSTSNYVIIQNATPRVTFDTDYVANCSISLKDYNYTDMIADDGITTCESGNATQHSCTVPSTQEVSWNNTDQLYISCIHGLDNFFNNETNSTSGQLNIKRIPYLQSSYLTSVSYLDLGESEFANEISEPIAPGENITTYILPNNISNNGFFIAKVANYNSSLNAYINGQFVGSTVKLDNLGWSVYSFFVNSTDIITNSTLILENVAGNQNTTYVDYVGVSDTQALSQNTNYYNYSAVAYILNVTNRTNIAEEYAQIFNGDTLAPLNSSIISINNITNETNGNTVFIHETFGCVGNRTYNYKSNFTNYDLFLGGNNFSINCIDNIAPILNNFNVTPTTGTVSVTQYNISINATDESSNISSCNVSIFYPDSTSNLFAMTLTGNLFVRLFTPPQVGTYLFNTSAIPFYSVRCVDNSNVSIIFNSSSSFSASSAAVPPADSPGGAGGSSTSSGKSNCKFELPDQITLTNIKTVMSIELSHNNSEPITPEFSWSGNNDNVLQVQSSILSLSSTEKATFNIVLTQQVLEEFNSTLFVGSDECENEEINVFFKPTTSVIDQIKDFLFNEIDEFNLPGTNIKIKIYGWYLVVFSFLFLLLIVLLLLSNKKINIQVGIIILLFGTFILTLILNAILGG